MPDNEKSHLYLNGICPYYTMFPIEFPLKHLDDVPLGVIYDPFCGRGTTAYAARLLGLPSVGVDVNPVAVAITRSKLVKVAPETIAKLAEQILAKSKPDSIPRGQFWKLAYHSETLNSILKLRAGLRVAQCPAAKALTGIILGALHGPLPKTKDSYFSNQMQRTFSPKPDYAVRYWKKHGLMPRKVDVIAVIRERAKRYFSHTIDTPLFRVLLGDSRYSLVGDMRYSATITSPPYYGMDTYIPDQWLRNWFLGGAESPDYGKNGQISQGDVKTFTTNLGKVWNTTAKQSRPGAKLVIRFGALRSRNSDPEKIIRLSLESSGMPWKIKSITCAGGAERGNRQANQMGNIVNKTRSIEEIDVVCYLN